MIDKQLFDRYLRNECNAEERRLVSEYLEAHPEIAGDYLPEEEFGAIEPAPWDQQRSEGAFRRVQQRLNGQRLRILKWGLATAAALLVMVFGLKWLRPAEKTGPSAPAVAAAQKPEEWLTEKNNSANARTLTLPDGSTAELAPGTLIAYHPTFAADDRRIVRLEGEGQFKVADDSKRPFTVMSGELATTALGTYFSVIADQGSAIIKVHLYNGKVRIETPGLIKWRTKDSALYLQPGQELTYNKEQKLAVVRSPKALRRDDQRISRTAKPRTAGQAQQLQPSLKPEWYMFGGQPLSEVFDQLSDYYGVQINYFPSDVSNRYFTGKFSKNDSLGDILKDISLLHGLSLKKVDDMYVFRKKEH